MNFIRTDDGGFVNLDHVAAVSIEGTYCRLYSPMCVSLGTVKQGAILHLIDPELAPKKRTKAKPRLRLVDAGDAGRP